jgi:hypothetical protein
MTAKRVMRFIVEIENFPTDNEWTPETISDAIGQSIDNWLHADGPEGIQNVVLNVRTLDKGGEDAPAPAQDGERPCLICRYCDTEPDFEPCRFCCREYNYFEPAPAPAPTASDEDGA